MHNGRKSGVAAVWNSSTFISCSRMWTETTRCATYCRKVAVCWNQEVKDVIRTTTAVYKAYLQNKVELSLHSQYAEARKYADAVAKNKKWSLGIISGISLTPITGNTSDVSAGRIYDCYIHQRPKRRLTKQSADIFPRRWECFKSLLNPVTFVRHTKGEKNFVIEKCCYRDRSL